jgi:hypothetical protein
MANKMGSRGWLGIGVTVLVLGGITILAIWLSLGQSTNPDYQVRHDRPGTIGEYFVNLWVEPQPPTTGQVEISSQLSTIIGTPIELSSMSIDVQPPDDGERRELDVRQTYEGPSDTDLYVADTEFDQPGSWQIIVTYSFGGSDIEDEFTIEVAE